MRGGGTVLVIESSPVLRTLDHEAHRTGTKIDPRSVSCSLLSSVASTLSKKKKASSASQHIEEDPVRTGT